MWQIGFALIHSIKDDRHVFVRLLSSSSTLLVVIIPFLAAYRKIKEMIVSVRLCMGGESVMLPIVNFICQAVYTPTKFNMKSDSHTFAWHYASPKALTAYHACLSR